MKKIEQKIISGNVTSYKEVLDFFSSETISQKKITELAVIMAYKKDDYEKNYSSKLEVCIENEKSIQPILSIERYVEYEKVLDIIFSHKLFEKELLKYFLILGLKSSNIVYVDSLINNHRKNILKLFVDDNCLSSSDTGIRIDNEYEIIENIGKTKYPIKFIQSFLTLSPLSKIFLFNLINIVMKQYTSAIDKKKKELSSILNVIYNHSSYKN